MNHSVKPPSARLYAALAALAVALAPAAPAPAEALRTSDILQARILPGWQEPDGRRFAGLELTLAPEWKTYWRSPGDAGIPPLFDWSASENLGALRIHWPRPHVFWQNGMRSVGYAERVVLPLELTPRDPDRPVHLRAGVDLGVCRDICVPAAIGIDSAIAGPGAPDGAIAAALRAVPMTGRAAGLASIGCTVAPTADGLRLTATLDLPPTGGDETVVIEPGRAAVWVSEATVHRDGGLLVAEADLVAESGQPFALDRSRVTVTVLGRDRAVEIAGCPAP
jgi:DsbC/DsbD-like thiol-disulfide interchange protein